MRTVPNIRESSRGGLLLPPEGGRWMVTVGGRHDDFAFSATERGRPPDLDRMLKFRRAFNRLAAEDPIVHRQILEVQHLIKPRSVMRDPALVERVQAVMMEA
jgi:hypothetical protein